jgi:hypothetical protein
MYSEPSDRQIPPLGISNLQRCWLRGFSNSVPKAVRQGSVPQHCGAKAALTAGRAQRESRRDAAAGRGQMRTYALAVDATSRDCLTGAREMRATPMAMNTADPISSL